MGQPQFPGVIAAALGVSFLMLVGFGIGIPFAPNHATLQPSVSNSNGGLAELAAAEESLSTGGGPALGHPVSCESVGVQSVQCGSLAATPAAFPSGAGWSNLTTRQGTNPGISVEGTMVWDASDGYALLWGGAFGTASTSTGQNVTWTYLNGVWDNVTATVSGGHPAGNLLGGLAYDPSTNVVVQFGGIASAHDLRVNSTWTYHDLVWTNVSAVAGPAPSPRDLCAFSEDSTDKEAVLFGGADLGGGFLADTWTYHDAKWTNITTTAGMTPGITAYPSLSDDPANHGALLAFVTEGPPDLVEATYEFAAGTWTNLTGTLAPAPPPSLLGHLVWSAQTDSVLLTAGILGYANNGSTYAASATWAFYQGAWVNLTATDGVDGSPTLSYSSAAGDGSIVMFGGLYVKGVVEASTDYLNVFALPPSVTSVVATPGVIDVGMSTNISAVTSGGIAPVGLNYSFGDGNNQTGKLTAEHAYATTGSFTVAFTARDFTGRSSTATTTVDVNPDLSISGLTASSTSVTTGNSIYFLVTSTGGTDPLTFAWTFGDGGTSTVSTPYHTYNSSGTYTVTVVVTDAAGAHQTKSISIQVSSPSSSAFSLTSGSGLYVLIIIVVVVVAVVVALALRMRKKPSVATPGAPPPWTPPAGSAPAGGPPPPPGPTIPPGAGGPPPGAA